MFVRVRKIKYNSCLCSTVITPSLERGGKDGVTFGLTHNFIII